MSGFDSDGDWPADHEGDAGDNDWGVFEDAEDNWGAQQVDPSNPVITARQDRTMHSPPVRNIRGQQGPVALVAIFDDEGEPMVARTVMENGQPKQLEEYRRPTPDEYNAVMFGKSARLVRGGVVGSDVSTSTNYPANAQRTPLGQVGGVAWKKVALYGGVVAAVGGGGWWAYNRYVKGGVGKKKKKK